MAQAASPPLARRNQAWFSPRDCTFTEGRHFTTAPAAPAKSQSRQCGCHDRNRLHTTIAATLNEVRHLEARIQPHEEWGATVGSTLGPLRAARSSLRGLDEPCCQATTDT